MNAFDFNDVSDLPQELQAKLSSGGSTEYTKVLKVLEAAKEAGRTSVTLTEIMAAATRMNVELPSEVTIRNWLNKCVSQGMAIKPTRQTYAINEDIPTETVKEDTTQVQTEVQTKVQPEQVNTEVQVNNVPLMYIEGL